MKKSKARKIISVLQGMDHEAQKSWLIQNKYAIDTSDATFHSTYDAILLSADL